MATYGFRGEAIASLCSVADVRFLTATESEAPMGTVIELDHAGQVRDASQRVARQVRDSLTQRGTTVTITNLLSSLPVRRRELERHIKREYGKAHAMLQAYALITQGVRWSSCVILPDGRRTSQLLVSASSGPDYLLSNFRALFGAKAAAGMQRLELPGASETDATLRGLVSKPILGHGRSSGDRQYFYVNGRPWDSPKLAQIFNQVYKMFNATQYPSVVANLELPPSAYDVNVAPDKRSIYLHDESALLTHWQDALHAVFAPSRGVLAVHGPVPVVQDAPAELPDAASGSRAEEPPATVPRRRAVDMEVVSTHSASWSSPPRRPAASAAQREDGMQSQFRRAVAHFAALTAGAPCAEASPPAKRARAALEYRESEGEEGSSDNSDELGAISHRPRDAECVSERHDNSGNAIDMDDEDHDGLEQVVDTTKDARLNTSSSAADDVKFAGEPCRSGAAAESLFLANPSSSSDSTGSPEVHARMETEDAPRQVPDASSAPGTQTVSSEQDELESSGEADHDFCEPTPSVGTRVRPPRLAVRENESGASLPTPLVLPATPVSPRRVRAPADTRSRTPTPSPPMAPPTPGPCTTVALDMAVLRAHSQQRARRLHAPQAWEGADVHRPDADAVAALERVIVKSDFTQMQIVGQFNLGFILARRTTSDMDDLFIIDQHAADEKYNFEALQTSTRIHSQRLLQPQRISLAPSDELVAREHAEWLRMNGFEVDIDEDAAPGSRVLLLAKPVSKGVVFDVHGTSRDSHRPGGAAVSTA